jgi:hypothetical protein
MRLTFFQYVVFTALTAQIVSAAELSASRAARDNTIINTAAASSHSTLRADEASPSNSESISDILTRALRADTVGLRSSNGIASFDEALGIPKCSSEGTSCDTGDLVNGRGPVYPEPNYPNTLGLSCIDGTSGGPSDESVDRIIVSSESGGYLEEDDRARITATVSCWADGYANDYVYFYYASDEANNTDWNFIERIQCTGGGQQTLTTSYTLPKGSNQAVRVSIRHMEDDLTNDGDKCGLGPFTDNDDVAFTVAAASTESPTSSLEPTVSPSTPRPTSQPTPEPTRVQTLSPTESPFVLFSYGESLVTDNNLDIQISDGLTAKMIARAGSRVNLANGGQSSRAYHMYMDGAGVTPLRDGGYVYVSNSEDDNGKAGVHGLYFSNDGQITDYKTLLYGTTWNCGGGKKCPET